MSTRCRSDNTPFEHELSDATRRGRGEAPEGERGPRGAATGLHLGRTGPTPRPRPSATTISFCGGGAPARARARSGAPRPAAGAQPRRVMKGASPQLSWLEPQAGDHPACTVEDPRAPARPVPAPALDPAPFEPALRTCARPGRLRRPVTRWRYAADAEPDGLLKKFIDEHLHTEDEALVLAGAGIFRHPLRRRPVDAGAGGSRGPLAVPANCYHRFLLTEEANIRCVRLFQDKAADAGVPAGLRLTPPVLRGVFDASG